MAFNLPQENDVLQLRQFFVDTRNLLDKCYWQTIASSVLGPTSILMHLALDFQHPIVCDPLLAMPRSLQKLGDMCNIPDQKLLGRYIKNQFYLIHTKHEKIEGKCVLVYYAPCWLRSFLFNSTRSHSFYPISLIIGNCQKAIQQVLELKQGCSHNLFHRSLCIFFTPLIYNGISGAGHIIESARNEPNSNKSLALRFLRFLSEIHWLDFYLVDHQKTCLANAIVQWVCITLVG
jgi:hypothetical protein